MAELFTLYKLIILYMLGSVDFPLTNSQLSEFILLKGYTTYFKQQQALAQLIDSGFIREEATHRRTFYHLTEEGKQTLHYFRKDIPMDIREDINAFLKERKYELKNEVSIKTDYFKNANLEYSVRCQVIEHDAPLIDLTVTVPTETEAQTFANNWLQKNQEVYASIMSALL